MRKRDAGEVDEAVMRWMLHELDLEEEALSASWLNRIQGVRGRTKGLGTKGTGFRHAAPVASSSRSTEISPPLHRHDTGSNW